MERAKYDCEYYVSATNYVCATCSLKHGYCNIKCKDFKLKKSKNDKRRNANLDRG